MANKENISSYKVVMCIACALLLILFFSCKSGSAGLKESISHNRTDSTVSRIVTKELILTVYSSETAYI